MATGAARASKAWIQRNKELQQAIITLYTSSSSPADLDKAFSACHSRIQFVDPFVDVKGIDNYQAQFRGLRWFFTSFKPQSVQTTADFDKIMMDATIEWQLGFLSFPLRMITILHVSEGGLGSITKHEDCWSLADLFLALPMIAFIYAWWRQFQGYWLSQLFLSRSKESWLAQHAQQSSSSVPSSAATAAYNKSETGLLRGSKQASIVTMAGSESQPASNQSHTGGETRAGDIQMHTLPEKQEAT